MYALGNCIYNVHLCGHHFFMDKKLLSWSLFIALCFIWGSSFFLMKLGSRGLSSPQIASLRIFTASIIFVPLAIKHFPKIPRNKRAYTMLGGLFGNLIPAYCFAVAITRIDSYLEGILNSLTPLWVIFIGILFFRDKVKPLKIAGVLIGFAGLCLLTFTQASIKLDNLAYTLLVIGGTLSYGLNINIVGHHLKGINPIYLTSVSLAAVCIPAACLLGYHDFFSLNFTNKVVLQSVLATMLLGIAASSAATFLFYRLVQLQGGLFASMVTYGIPFVALLWGLLDGETVSITEILCLPKH